MQDAQSRENIDGTLVSHCLFRPGGDQESPFSTSNTTKEWRTPSGLKGLVVYVSLKAG